MRFAARPYLQIAYAALVCMALNSCAGPATAPTAVARTPTAPATEVGVVSFIPNQYRHIHVGTTVFNNFEQTYVPKVNLTELVAEEMTLAVRSKTAFQPKVLAAPVSLPDTDEKFFVEDMMNTWRDGKLTPSFASELQSLMTRHQLSRLLVAAPGTTGAYGIPTLPQLGIYSRSFMGIDKTFAYAGLRLFWVDSSMAVTIAPAKLDLMSGPSTIRRIKEWKDTLGKGDALSAEEEQTMVAAIRQIIRAEVENAAAATPRS